MADSYPRIAQVVIDTTDARALAEFYRQLFGLEYRAGDDPPAPINQYVAAESPSRL
jgi:hypothetical protein